MKRQTHMENPPPKTTPKIQTMELLAPGGSIDAIKAAIAAGADAVYCGLEKFSARDRAANVSIDQMPGVIRLAHENHVRIFMTLNIMIVETEILSVLRLLNKLISIPIDGIIVQDIGLAYLLRRHFPHFQIHGSTQLTTHNAGQIRFLSRLNVSRVNLSRELKFQEIGLLTQTAHTYHMETEVFVHGAQCICFSGLCYSSSVKYGNSGNRGRCSQPCREEYVQTAKGARFPLNVKDSTAFLDLPQLQKAGVDSLKIEGRIKKFNYVYAVVSAFRKQLTRLSTGKPLRTDDLELRQVYNRDLQNAFLTGQLHKNMFIDNPKDNSAKYLLHMSGAISDKQIKRANRIINDAKKSLIEEVKNRIAALSIDKIALHIDISGQAGTPLEMTVTYADGTSRPRSIKLRTKSSLAKAKDPLGQKKSENAVAAPAEQLTRKMFEKKFRPIKYTAYRIEEFELRHLQPNLRIAFDEIVRLKERLLEVLNGQPPRGPVTYEQAPTQPHASMSPTLSVLIADSGEIPSVFIPNVIYYFALPNALGKNWKSLVRLFQNHHQLVPWFPAILIGDDFDAAVSLVDAVRPAHLVTNNLGIAHHAYLEDIPWTAGPYLNIANSLSLRCLKEQFNCEGAFVSNELSQSQIQKMAQADEMPLHYRMFYPITLMTSRQCLFHQVGGCKKSQMDNDCLPHCSKTDVIVDLKGARSYIEKSPGHYHRIFHDRHFLNTNICTDLSNVFSSYLIDLRSIHTDTRIDLSQTDLIHLFYRHIAGDKDATIALRNQVQPTTQDPYAVGV